jgi:MurNAc alpha-1-phosphate uridylyltransferase
MTGSLPKIAMVLAAGRGVRLRPLTDQLPKPLVQVAGQSLIDRTLNRLVQAGVTTAVVNLHYKSEMLRAHLEKRQEHHKPDIIFSDESEQLLDTGGGVCKALADLGDQPFIVTNSDFILRDAYIDSLAMMGTRWNDKEMDALLLMQPTVGAHGFSGRGDYGMGADGGLVRRSDQEVAPFIFAGIQILHPRLFQDCPEGPFSLNWLYDNAEEAGRLFGVRHEGDWFDVGTPDGLEVAQRLLSAV